ncbi:response regulator [Aetokthonos hydrillicola Thurmond2011]|jgi:twitching motility two-component system response regulator PilG|uniref:Protein PatA n=1 Tax=Aetokthonos hydrillicola Thurmond2011 TaxID=2712845 RepID=A0AAP5MB49_9CYAN|nr:response regulator [Aetokthonos hydrillicola]MBO3457369.1 response regulator [Aetokthonos hydrillicola CCALA 1050]MBW4583954.1 response regulator [Aetokthonos hydrillicola CCALA 1050]MDR9898850.1 response regulator [Aetokthonos hydrillicola Thurmond2011]
MSTTPIGSYKFSQKLHPLSLLAQLTSRRATGCLRVFLKPFSWSIYLEDGKLTYASCSDQLFERLENHLERLSEKYPSLNLTDFTQVPALFDTNSEKRSQADYQAICWLVEKNYITPPQAAELIDELAKEVLESFLTLKEGNYEFNSVGLIDDLPKFCRLDLRVLVEYCQKQLRTRRNERQSVSEYETSHSLPTSTTKLPSTQITVDRQLPKPPSFDNSVQNEKNFQQPSGQSTYTVACIDDSPTVLNSIKQFLDDNTFSVVMINDPVKALMQILRSKPDIILLDVEMPNLDGYELCSLLRRHSAFKNTPIIMVTGRTGFIDRAKAKIVRASGYLTKPFTKPDLLKMLFKHIT